MASSATARRILCLDDNDDACELLTAYLKPEGYEVVSVGTLEEALKLVKSQGETFDLYFFDVRVSDGLSMELCQYIRTIDAHTPIIISSGDTRETIRQEALQFGAQAFIGKPIDYNSLIGLMETLIEAASYKKGVQPGKPAISSKFRTPLS